MQMNNYDRIYPGNDIHPTAIIYDGVVIGIGNVIGPYCIIGGPAEKHGYFNVTGRVYIGDNNTFTKQVTIDSGTTKVTEIGSGCVFLKNAHVGHDAVIDDKVTLSCNVCIGGHTAVLHSTNFGLGAVAHQRLLIPQKCMIGMNTTITKRTELEPGMKYVGSPARCIGPNVRP